MAGTVERTLALKLIGDVSGISRDLKKVDGRLARSGKAAMSWGKAFGGAIAIAGLEKAVDLIGDAWAGFREGQKVAAQLGVTWKNLGLAGDDLAGTLDKVTSSATKLGISDDEAVMAFNKALQVTKDQAEAMRRLKIAYDLVANGSAPDLSSAMDIIRLAGKGSARVVDKFGLTARTSGGRIRELGNRVKGAAKKAAALDPLGVLFTVMDEDLESIVGNLASGDIDGAIEAIAGAGDHLAEAWRDVFPDVEDTADKLTGGGVTAAGDQLTAAAEAAVALGDAFTNAKSALDPLLDVGTSFLNMALLPITTSMDSATGVLRILTDLLKGDFDGALQTAQGSLQDLAGSVSRAFERLLADIRRIAQNVVDVWNSLGKIDAGSFQLWGPSHWGIPGTDIGIEIPGFGIEWGAMDLIPNLGNILKKGGPGGRRGWGAPSGGVGGSIKPPSTDLPGHREGLDYVPYDGYVAALHRGERVMTAAENRGGGASYNVNVTVNGYVGSEQQLAREINRILAGGVQRGMRLGAR